MNTRIDEIQSDETCSKRRWSKWRAFPDPETGGYLHAPFGPGVYQLRNRRTDEKVLFGEGKNVAERMTSLLPPPFGTGQRRRNKDKQEYVRCHLSDIDYRTRACADKLGAVAEERAFRKKDYIFRT